MTSSDIQDAAINLDQAYVKVPLEQSRRIFRNEMKLVDRDLLSMAADLGGVEDEVKRGRLKARAMSLYDKLVRMKEQSYHFRGKFYTRLSFIANISHEDAKSTSFNRYQRAKFGRMIVEHLYQSDLIRSAEVAGRAFDLDIDDELYSEIHVIKNSLLRKSAISCLNWCSENRTQLKKMDSPLEFLLRRQEFVELIRNAEQISAINYARKHFPQFSESNEQEIEQAMALLAVQPTSESQPYKWLYDCDRWQDLILQFEKDSKKIHGLYEQSQLVSFIQAGLTALKTLQCGLNTYRNCPVCSDPLRHICRRIPYAHHDTSLLVCSATGLIMDTENIPMALPNGYVYSKHFIEESSRRNQGYVVCPRSQQKFKVTEARKCYIS